MHNPGEIILCWPKMYIRSISMPKTHLSALAAAG